jgi:homoserine kinase
MSKISVRVPATSANLGPGFDALGLAFALYNEVSLEVSDENRTQAEGEGANLLNGADRTIVHQAALRVFAQLKIPASGVDLSLKNRIPLARGLGSSSAAIVGGLVAANSWCQREHGHSLHTYQLLQLANEIEGHPDNVAPALLGGLVVSAVNSAGRVQYIQLPVSKYPRFLVFIPDEELSTHQARSVLPSMVSMKDAVFNLSRAALLVSSLTTQDWSVLPEALQDKLHQQQRGSLIPAFGALSGVAREAGAIGATISGAGPTVLFWLPDVDEVAATVQSALQNTIRQEGFSGRLLPLAVDTAGCVVTEA